jgi:hypothetical protein
LYASPNPDIAGVWEATTPEGTFRVLSVPDLGVDGCYNFLMLELGDVEEEFGFETGENLAKLTPSSDNCWIAEERFHYPLWAGGGYYIGETSYCIDEDTLLFHTDDEGAVFSDYPLSKIADGIDAAGIWRYEEAEAVYEIMLYPLQDGGWEAMLIGENSLFDDADLESGDVIFRGEIPPDSDGEDCEGLTKFGDNEHPARWVSMRAILEDSQTLRFGFEMGVELGWIWFDFNRVF